MNMVGYFFHHTKKKQAEKNTQACLWNMRGSLPLLHDSPLEKASPRINHRMQHTQSHYHAVKSCKKYPGFLS